MNNLAVEIVDGLTRQTGLYNPQGGNHIDGTNQPSAYEGPQSFEHEPDAVLPITPESMQPGKLNLTLPIPDGLSSKPTDRLKTTDVHRVSYVTYALGGINLGSKGTQAQHVALCIYHDKGEIEYHMNTDGFVTYDKCGQYRDKKLGEYEILKFPNRYFSELDSLIREKFEGTSYHLGKNDCFKVAEYVAQLLGLKRSDLAGPAGQRRGVANGVRHYGGRLSFHRAANENAASDDASQTLAMLHARKEKLELSIIPTIQKLIRECNILPEMKQNLSTIQKASTLPSNMGKDEQRASKTNIQLLEARKLGLDMNLSKAEAELRLIQRKIEKMEQSEEHRSPSI